MDQAEVDRIKQQDISAIEKARLLGLDISVYIERDGEWWVPPGDSQFVIEAVNPDKIVKPGYIKNAYENQGVKRVLVLSPRGYAYNLADLLEVTVKPPGMPKDTKLDNYKPHAVTDAAKQNMLKAQQSRRKREKAE